MKYDVVIIGAGPSGVCAASILNKNKINHIIIEKEQFPRFVIGESLLPQCMSYLDEAQLTKVVSAYGFQRKNGAMFLRDGHYSTFNFKDKSTLGPSETYQVKRSEFDQLLSEQVKASGSQILFEHSVKDICFHEDGAEMSVSNNIENTLINIEAKFVIDASGYGRVLPRVLDLNSPSDFPVRRSVFCHIKDHIDPIKHPYFDRDKILITVHKEYSDIWYWLIPFSDGTSSLGFVAKEEQMNKFSHLSKEDLLFEFVNQDTELKGLLKNAEIIRPCEEIHGYSTNVKTLYGDRFVLLGNAGEFLDPVFSSGITIALKSAVLAAPLVADFIQGKKVNWESDFVTPLNIGINTFKEFVKSWYTTDLQKVIFYENPNKEVKEKVCSILAGYAWDQENPFVNKPQKRLKALSELCSNTQND